MRPILIYIYFLFTCATLHVHADDNLRAPDLCSEDCACADGEALAPTHLDDLSDGAGKKLGGRPLKRQIILERIIGSGGFGVVYKGELIEANGSKQDVAIKEVIIDNRLDDSSVHDFAAQLRWIKLEAQILRHLRDTHVPGVNRLIADFSERSLDSTSQLFVFELFTMDLLNFLTLSFDDGALLFPRGLPNRILSKVVEDLGLALSCLHEAGVVHKDIKPENALIKLNCDLDKLAHAVELKDDANISAFAAGFELCLCDFGLSDFDRSHFGFNVHPVSGDLRYIAPEIIEPYVSNASDLEIPSSKEWSDDYFERSRQADAWSLGVVSFTLCTTRELFPKRDDSLGTLVACLRVGLSDGFLASTLILADRVKEDRKLLDMLRAVIRMNPNERCVTEMIEHARSL